MIIDASVLADHATLRADLAVVGGGPAGIVTALEVAGYGFDVLLLESGRKRADHAAQQLAEAGEMDASRHAPMSLAVRRQLGGTSVIWGGRCVPFDEVDFDQRPWISDSTWPITNDQLRPYYQSACDWLRCGRAVFNTAGLTHLPTSLVPGLRDGTVCASALERWSLPTDFAREYRRPLKDSDRVKVVTGLTCTEIVCPPGQGRVGQLLCRSLEGKQITVRCRAYVIAAGGLDSTRLLLSSRGPEGPPPGNHSGHLGEWYMSHVEGVIANIRFATPPQKTIFNFERDIDGTYVRRRLTLSRAAQHEHQLPNVAAWLANRELADPRHGSGVLSFAYLTLRSPVGRVVAPDAQRLSLSGEDVPGSPYGGAERGSMREHLHNIARDLDSVASFAASFGAKRFLARQQRAPGFYVYSRENVYPLLYHGEQRPNRRSRVSLASGRDELGMPRLRIDLQFAQEDIDGILRCHQVWDDYLRLGGWGRLDYLTADPAAMVWRRAGGGFHQLGTTRMSARPQDGVVDENLAVHGMENLFVASSSVFVTAGQANPTFMIIVFALRLASHLSSVLPRLVPAAASDRQ